MDGQRLFELLRPVRRRIMWLRTAEMGLLGAVCGTGAGLLFSAAAWLLPVAHYRAVAAAFVPVGGVAGVFWALALHRVTHEEAAKAVDAAGADDAVQTSLQYAQEDTPIARLQREGSIRLTEAYVSRMPKAELTPALKRRLWIVLGSVAALAVMLLLPSPMDPVVAKRLEEAKWVDQQKEKVEELKERLAAEKLPPENKKPMEETLSKLEDGLEQSNTAPEALDEMEKAMKELDQHSKTLEKQLAEAEEFADRMKQQPMLKQVVESLRQMDGEALQKRLEGLRGQILKLTPEQKEALAKELEKLAAMAQNPDAETERKLREAMEKTAAELKAQAKAEGIGAASDPKQLEEQLKQLEKQLGEALKQLQENAAQLAAMAQQAAQVAQLGQPMAGRLASQGAALSAAWASGGLVEALAAAGGDPGAMDGAMPGAGAGAGVGQGAGQGGGAGAAQGAGAGAGAGGGTGGLQGGFGSGSRNLVATPRSMEGSGNVQSDQGPTKGGGGEVQKGGPAPVIDGASRPYEEVYSQYAAEAKNALNRHPLPQNMQNLVRDYFLEIQPDR